MELAGGNTVILYDYFKIDKKITIWDMREKNMTKKKNVVTPHRAPRLKKGLLLGAVVVCALVTLLVGRMVGLHGRTGVAITLDGQRIKPEVLDQIMQQQVSEVVFEFSKLGVHGTGAEYWSTQCNGKTPGASLTELTLQQLRTLAAMYDMAQETGTPLEGGVNGIPERMEAENQSREEKKAAGQPVYGLSQFTFETYLEYEMDWLEKQYCSNPDNPGMQVTEEERQAYYQQNRETQFKLPDGISFSYVYMDTNFMDAQQAENLAAQVRELEQAMEDGGTLEEQVQQYPELQQYFGHLDLEPSQVSAYMDTMGDVLDLAYELEPGTHSGVMEANGGVYLVQCTARTYDHYIALDEVADSIDETLRRQRYAQMVESRGESLEFAGDEQEILAYVIDQMTGKR